MEDSQCSYEPQDLREVSSRPIAHTGPRTCPYPAMLRLGGAGRIHRNHRQQPAHFRAPYRIERKRTDHGRRDDAESCIFADGGTADGEHHRIDQLQGGIADHGDAEKHAHDHEQTLECQSPHALPVSPRRHTTASSVMHVLRYSATTASERDNCHDEPSWAS